MRIFRRLLNCIQGFANRVVAKVDVINWSLDDLGVRILYPVSFFGDFFRLDQFLGDVELSMHPL